MGVFSEYSEKKTDRVITAPHCTSMHTIEGSRLSMGYGSTKYFL